MNPIRGVEGASFFPAPGAKPAEKADGFASALAGALERTDAHSKSAMEAAEQLAAGKADSPHEVMIRLEEAHLALSWTVQVRNRVLEAYNEIMRMPL